MSVYPKVAGAVNYSSDSTNKFIPEIWSGKMQVKFYKSTVFGEIANTDWEGEIKNQGDTVIIRTIPTITINDHAIDQNLDYESPESPAITMVIDQGKSFSFKCHDIVKKQMDMDYINKFSDDAGQQMKIKIDNVVLNGVYDEAHASNIGSSAGYESSSYDMGSTGSPIILTKANILEYIVDMGSILTEQNVPETGRWIVIPAWMAGLIKKSDLKDVSLTGDSVSPVRNGKLGTIDEFTIYKTNNYTADANGDYNVLFGHPTAISFASQMTETEHLRNPFTFGMMVRGLNTFGYKVTKTESLGVIVCNKS